MLFGEGIFLLWEINIFLLLGRILPNLQGFLQTVGLQEGQGSPNSGRSKQDEKRGEIFCKMGNTGGITQV